MRFIVAVLIGFATAVVYGQDAESFYQRGRQLYDEGKYQPAADTLRRAASLFADSGNLSGQISAQNLYGECLANLSKCDLALSVLEPTLQLATTNFADETPEVAESYYYLARATGGCARRWDEAIALMHKATVLKQKVYGDDSPEIALNYTFMGYMQHSRGQYDSALYYLNLALSIRQTQTPRDEVETSNVLFHMGNTHMVKGDLLKALDLELKSLTIRKEKLGPYHASLSNTISVIGGIYQRLGNHERALEYYHRALEIRKRALGPEHANVAASYYTIGTVYSNLLNYSQALQYIQQGNRIYENLYGESSDVLPTYYAYTGRLYGRIGEHKTAEAYFRKAQRQIENNLREDHPFQGVVYSLVAEYCSDNGDLTRAQAYADKAVRIYRKAYGEGTGRESDILTRLGTGYLRAGKVEEATALFEASQAMLKKRHGEESPALAGVYHHLGNAMAKRGRPDEALVYYRKALRSLSSSPERLADVYANPDVAVLENKLRGLSIAASKIDALATLRLHDHVLATARFCLNLMEEIGFGYHSETERTELEELSRRVYNRFLGAAYARYRETHDSQFIWQAFRVSEKSRAAMLLENIRDANAKQLAGVPDSLVSLERDLKILRAYHLNRLYQEQKSGRPENIEVLQKDIFDTEQHLEELKRYLEKNFATYFYHKYTLSGMDVDHIQGTLDDNAVLVEYFTGDSAIYVFGVTKSEINLLEVPLNESLLMQLKGYQKSLADGSFILNQRDSADNLYTHTAFALYETLLAPLLPQHTTKVIVVPDGPLATLNFGTLLTTRAKNKNPDYRTLSYLFRDYAVSYAYSAHFIRAEAQRGLRARHRLAAFAPSYSGVAYNNTTTLPQAQVVVRDGMLPLPGAQKEAEMITAFMGGHAWLEEEATETNFKQFASEYEVLHLAMHSLVNNENPIFSELLFSPTQDELNDGYLSVAEIYNLNLRARMVVLSACSSGSGKVQLGEGPITLSRAFSYAGCPSVVMSLWKIPDNVTSDIMTAFYRELKNGSTKDNALRNAQMTFLNDSSDPLSQHPYFWAGFVVMGDATPLPSWSPHLLSLAGAFLLILLSVAIYLSRRRHRAQKAESKVPAS